MQAKSRPPRPPRIRVLLRVITLWGYALALPMLAKSPAPDEGYTPEQREEIGSSFQKHGEHEEYGERQSHQAHDDSSFITPQEYGANLYENPRGIGCVKCHGRDGEENLLASYTHKGKQKYIIAPRINNLSFPAFKIALSKDNGVMPRYNLTDDEINAIYLYITSRNKTFQ